MLCCVPRCGGECMWVHAAVWHIYAHAMHTSICSHSARAHANERKQAGHFSCTAACEVRSPMWLHSCGAAPQAHATPHAHVHKPAHKHTHTRAHAHTCARTPRRLVTQLRHRTLDAVEAIGAWHRRTDSSVPFMYANVGNYLAHIGSDLVGVGAWCGACCHAPTGGTQCCVPYGGRRLRGARPCLRERTCAGRKLHGNAGGFWCGLKMACVHGAWLCMWG